MSKQNIYDNEIFFDRYKQLRESDANYNIQLEQPAMNKLLPDLYGKNVLDLGCGYGQNCMDFIRNGATSVVGIDISKKMLEVANKEFSDKRIKYLHMNMTDLSRLSLKFDVIYSSLAFHYINDFEALSKDIYASLNNGGYLLFSQEHPIVTATLGGHQHFNKNEKGEIVSFTFSNYGTPGKRETFWYVDGVEKYHRRFSDIITILCKTGFIIDTVCEPFPDLKAKEKIPSICIKEEIKPTFLIVRARKP